MSKRLPYCPYCFQPREGDARTFMISERVVVSISVSPEFIIDLEREASETIFKFIEFLKKAETKEKESNS